MPQILLRRGEEQRGSSATTDHAPTAPRGASPATRDPRPTSSCLPEPPTSPLPRWGKPKGPGAGQGRGDPAAAPPTLPGRPLSVLRPLGRRDMAGASRVPSAPARAGFPLRSFPRPSRGRAEPGRAEPGERRQPPQRHRLQAPGHGGRRGCPRGTPREPPGCPPASAPHPRAVSEGSAYLCPCRWESPGFSLQVLLSYGKRGSEQAGFCCLLNVCVCGYKNRRKKSRQGSVKAAR